MSFSIVIQCPRHPGYNAKTAPGLSCKFCNLMFAARNEANKVTSTPRDERTAVDEIIIKGIAE
jgi:hypothetical protein